MGAITDQRCLEEFLQVFSNHFIQILIDILSRLAINRGLLCQKYHLSVDGGGFRMLRVN